MFKRKKRLMSLGLATIITTTLLSGCTTTEPVVEQIVFPETTLLQDEYARQDYIDGFFTYNVDYITDKADNQYENDKLYVETLFKHPQVQVDDWGSITVGVTTMGEIANYVDASNTYFVESNTQAVIDARQKEIDDEYNAAKAKAEAKGKEYTKQKKEVRTDDIHFEEPYTYDVFIENTEGKDQQDAEPGWTKEYEPTLLVDSSKSALIVFQVYKYGVPYMNFECKSVENLYNPGIIQEADWVCNGVQAADVSYYVNKDVNGIVLNTADFVDEDYENKGAKKNTYMTGDLSFSGDGISWSSLKELCEALKLNFKKTEPDDMWATETDKDAQSYEQYSEQEFMYYTIEYLANSFDTHPEQKKSVTFPIVTLIARFNPLSQVCVDWNINTYFGSKTYENCEHLLSEEKYVGVTEYKVDTKDYEGMRVAMQNWIDTNAYPYTTAYCATDYANIKEPVTHIIDTGTKNLYVEPVIGGVQYVCVGKDTDKYGQTIGKYIPESVMNEAAAMGESEGNYLKHENTKEFVIECCLLDETGAIVEKIDEKAKSVIENGDEYVLLSYEETDEGLKNMRFIEPNKVEDFLAAYIRTYELTAAQSEELRSNYETSGADGIKTYIDGLFAEAERAKNALLGIDVNIDDKIAELKLVDSMETNTVLDIKQLSFNDTVIDLPTLTVEKLIELGFSESKDQYLYNNDSLQTAGTFYSFELPEEEKEAIVTMSNEWIGTLAKLDNDTAEIQMFDQEGNKIEKDFVIIGQPYAMSAVDAEDIPIVAFDENPAKIALPFPGKYLIDDAHKSLTIAKFNDELGGYVSVGGVADADSRMMLAEITSPGKYALIETIEVINEPMETAPISNTENTENADTTAIETELSEPAESTENESTVAVIPESNNKVLLGVQESEGNVQILTTEKKSDKNENTYKNANMFKFYNGICVGMTETDVLNILNEIDVKEAVDVEPQIENIITSEPAVNSEVEQEPSATEIVEEGTQTEIVETPETETETTGIESVPTMAPVEQSVEDTSEPVYKLNTIDDKYIIAKNKDAALVCILNEDKVVDHITLIDTDGFVDIEELINNQEVEDFDETQEEVEEDPEIPVVTMDNTMMIVLAVISIVMTIVMVLMMIGIWKVYTKLGLPGWASLVPIYNIISLNNVATGNSILTIVFILFPPAILYLYYKAFMVLGKSKPMSILFAIFFPIGMLACGFGKKQTEFVEENNDIQYAFADEENEDDEPKFFGKADSNMEFK